jgi:protoporphyrinogen IX oxidase
MPLSPSLYLWVKVLHLVGIALWIAGVWAGIWLLKAHVNVEASSRPALVGAERKAGASMDAGATFAIIGGFLLAFGGPINAFKTGGWLHIKLTLVVLGILSVHGLVRVKMKKYRNGDLAPLPGWVIPVFLVCVIGVIALGANPTLLRK